MFASASPALILSRCLDVYMPVFSFCFCLCVCVFILACSSDTDPLVVNISDEMAKTAVWKAVNSSAESCVQPVKLSGR